MGSSRAYRYRAPKGKQGERMTHVSRPNVGTLPRQRTHRLRNLGAFALVIAIGASIAFGISVATNDAVPASPSGNTFTAQREGQTPPATVNQADRSYLNYGSARSLDEAMKQAVKQGQIPAQAFEPGQTPAQAFGPAVE